MFSTDYPGSFKYIGAIILGKKVKGTDILHVLPSNRCGKYDLNLYINDAAVVTVIGLDNTRIIQLLSLLFMYVRVIKLDLIVFVFHESRPDIYGYCCFEKKSPLHQ